MSGFILRIRKRIRKYIVLLVLLPVLLAAFSFFFAKGTAGPSNYTATVTLTLGKYDDGVYNNIAEVTSLLKSDAFLKQALGDLKEEERQDVKNRLILTNQSDTQLQLAFTDAKDDQALAVVKQVSDTFLKQDNALFSERQQVIERRLSALEGESVSDDSKVDKERFLYELESTKLGMKQAKIVDPAQVIDEGNKGMSAKKRALLGLIIGLSISFMFVVLPELFKES
ncbi:teichuronic acid biosynthesis protein TuaF [Bacillus sp. 179-C3.3 HS]|uniref:teichuronic acid biosynthesis protein TuaF n=1 Tax=Bacillus sp. 179-C3.3 HS TaxID=3232162 RepID=UPI00399F98A5